MNFKRIEAKSYKIRRLQVAEQIRTWAKIEIMADTRPYGKRARIQDVFLFLISEGLKLQNKIVFCNKYTQTKMTVSTNLTKIPAAIHQKIERVRKAVEAGSLKKSGKGVVDSYNVIMCLIEAGFYSLNPEKQVPE